MKKLLLIISFVFISCNNVKTPERIIKYRGGVVIEKLNVPHHLFYTLEYKNKVIEVKVYEIDFIYNVGDTIK